MTVILPQRSPTVATIDGVDYQILRDGQNGLGWNYVEQVHPPGKPTQEELGLRYAQRSPSYERVIDWDKWRYGIGADTLTDTDAERINYSDGPAADIPGQLRRAHERREVDLATGEATTDPVTDFFALNGQTYVVQGDYVRRLLLNPNHEDVAAAKSVSGAAAGDADGVWLPGAQFTEASPVWTVVSGVPPTQTETHCIYLAATGSPIVRFDGTTWTVDTVDGNGDAAMVVGYWALGQYSDGQRLWAGNGSRVQNLPAGQDPLTAAQWSVQFDFGNRQATITALAALRDTLLVTTTDGLVYRLNMTGADRGLPAPLIDYRSAIPNATSGHQLRIWNGVLFAPLARGLFEYIENANGTGGTFEAVGPESLLGASIPTRGPCTALCALEPERLYASFWNGLQSYVMTGRRPRAGESSPQRIIWDAACPELERQRVTAIHVDYSQTNPILLLGTHFPALHFITLPRPGQTPGTDANCRSWLLPNACVLPDNDGNTPTTVKTFRWLRVSSRLLSSAERVNVYVRIDRATGWELVGTVNSSPMQEIVLPDDTHGYTMAVMLEFTGTIAFGLFPYVTQVSLGWTPREQRSHRWIEAQLFVAHRQLTDSGFGRVGVGDRLLFLSDLLVQETPVTVVGPDGHAYSCLLDQSTGLNRKLMEQVTGIPEPGTLVACRLNIYDETTATSPGVYEQSAYSQLARDTFFDTAP